MAKKWNGRRVAKKVGEALELEDDFLLREIEDAETKEEAVERMESIQRDVEEALEIIEEEGGE